MTDYTSARSEPAVRRAPNPRLVGGALLAAFALGAAGVWYFTGGPSSLEGLFTISSAASEETASPAAEEPSAAPAIPLVDVPDQGFDQRLTDIEQRLSRINREADTAAGDAARAEGLLIAFAARRAIERGAPLGYLEQQIQLRFGEARPNAVQTLITASRNPVTLDQLLARLDGLAPELAKPPPSEGTVDWLVRQAGSLFVVRREDSPSPAPERRIDRARMFIESGRMDAAISEVKMMPNPQAARNWVVDAERYAAAQRALELLETAAILEPRELRDGSGDRVGQASPIPSL